MWNPFARNRSDEIADAPTAVVPEPHVASGAASHHPPSQPGQHEIAQIDVIGGIAIVTLTVGELCNQRGAAMLADLLDQVVDSGVRHMILDIQNITFMDSACVGCMVEALNRLSQSGGRIALANPASEVAHIFRITRLDRVFPICGDVLAAMSVLERER